MKEIRKEFPQFIVDQVYIEQDGVCANKNCFNPLAHGFHRHHKDGNPSNISKENCQLLCLECHFATYKGEENPLEKHRELQRKIIGQIGSALAKTFEGQMTGSTLERVLTGFQMQESLSWKEKGLNIQVEYPSPTFAMLRQMMKQGIVQEAFLEGFKEGVRTSRGGE